MSFLLAGQYGPEAILSQSGTPFALGSVQVYESNGSTPATLYTDQTKGTGLANPITADSFGNVKFFADPGIYVLSFTIGGVTTTLAVQVLPFNSDIRPNVTYSTTLGSLAAHTVAEGANFTTSQVTVSPGGLFLITAQVPVELTSGSVSTDGGVAVAIQINGTTPGAPALEVPAVSITGNPYIFPIAWRKLLANNDQVGLQYLNGNSGGSSVYTFWPGGGGTLYLDQISG